MLRTLRCVALLCALPSCTGGAPAPGKPHEAIVTQLGATTMETERVLTDHSVVRVTSFAANTPPADDVAALRSSCDRSDLAACVTLGNMRQQKGDYAGAESVWRPACDAGFADGCFSIANMLSNDPLGFGRGPEIIALFQKACDLDHVGACYFLGVIYARGQYGATVDPSKARALHERACKDDGFWACQMVLGPGRAR